MLKQIPTLPVMLKHRYILGRESQPIHQELCNNSTSSTTLSLKSDDQGAEGIQQTITFF